MRALLLFLSLAFGVCAQKQEHNLGKLNGDSVGETLEQYRIAHPTDCMSALDAKDNRPLVGCINRPDRSKMIPQGQQLSTWPTFAGFPIRSEGVAFCHRTLCFVEYELWLEAKEIDIVDAALEKEYGKPSHSRLVTFQNASGAQEQMSKTTWTGANAEIVFEPEKKDENVWVMGVIMTSPDFAEAYKEANPTPAL